MSEPLLRVVHDAVIRAAGSFVGAASRAWPGLTRCPVCRGRTDEDGECLNECDHWSKGGEW